MSKPVPLKKWPVEIWVVTKNGKPDDYAFGRASAFRMASRRRKLEPDAFWSVVPAKATLSVGERS